MSKADDNLFLIAAVVGVGVIAYLAFSNQSSASPVSNAVAPASPPATANNSDWGALDPSSW